MCVNKGLGEESHTFRNQRLKTTEDDKIIHSIMMFILKVHQKKAISLHLQQKGGEESLASGMGVLRGEVWCNVTYNSAWGSWGAVTGSHRLPRRAASKSRPRLGFYRPWICGRQTWESRRARWQGTRSSGQPSIPPGSAE